VTRRAKGEGSVYQRHDHESCPSVVDGERPDHRCRGRWVATISYPNDAGKRDRKVIYGKTKTEVINKRKEAERKAPAKRVKVDKSHTVESWMNEWLETVATHPPNPIKPSTKRSHRSKIDQYIVPLIGMHRLDRLEAKHIRRMYARMQSPCPQPTKDGKCRHSPSHGLSEATARQTHAILARALKVAKRERLVSEIETDNLDAPGTATKERDRLTVAQAKLVLAAATDDPHVSRWYAALQMGLRQGEALGLPWGLVDFEANTISIARTLESDGSFGTPKSDAGNRTIVMFPEFRAHLMAHYGAYLAKCHEDGRDPEPTDCVWTQASGKPFGAKTDSNRWHATVQRAAMPKVVLHSARQTCAAWLEELGWPERVAAEFLGHSDVKQTYKYQRGHSLDSQRRAMGEIGSALGSE
jgi:integrase